MIRSVKSLNMEEGKRVLVRVDWNVPFGKNGEIEDTSRILASVETINFLLQNKAKVIVMTHLGDVEKSTSLILGEVSKLFPNTEIKFVQDLWNGSSGKGREILESLTLGEMAVLENLRFWQGEEDNDPKFAEDIASLADVYVNEAFSSSHREHASVVGVPKLLPSYAGFHFLEEVEKLKEVFTPDHPFLFILGGAKFETKLPLVEKFLNIADNIFIGGAIAQHAKSSSFAQNPKIIFPKGDIASLDASKETLEDLKLKIENSKLILWNGPLGNYENGYKEGTESLAKMIAESGVKAIVGGGDTVASIKNLNIEDKFYFLSIAGGATLDFLANGTLPGIEALQD